MKVEDSYPKRIVCLTEECVETLYLLGEQDRIVGISNYAVRPKNVRKDKKVICSFINANIEKILSLEPDLVIGYSDIQAEIAKKLIKRGITVWINNYRNINGIKIMINQLGLLVGKQNISIKLTNQIDKEIKRIKDNSSKLPFKPKVYFEEWFDPIISSIKWVSEIIEVCGGENFCNSINAGSLAKDRIISNDSEIISFNPDIILVSWCGKKFRKEKMVSREKWNLISAVKNNEIHEIDSSIILQPGPAALTDGLKIINNIIQKWSSKQTK